jgi:hypothetical protein
MRRAIRIGLILTAITAASFGFQRTQAAEDTAALGKALPERNITDYKGILRALPSLRTVGAETPIFSRMSKKKATQ